MSAPILYSRNVTIKLGLTDQSEGLCNNAAECLEQNLPLTVDTIGHRWCLSSLYVVNCQAAANFIPFFFYLNVCIFLSCCYFDVLE